MPQMAQSRVSDPNGWGSRFNTHWVNILLLDWPLMPILPILCFVKNSIDEFMKKNSKPKQNRTGVSFGKTPLQIKCSLSNWPTDANCNLVEFFRNNTPNLTFLAFLYKIDITGFQNQQKKIASTGYWTHNTNPTITILTALTTQPPRHLLNRISLNWTWIISGSIEHDFIRVWKFKTSMDWQIGWVGKAVRILIVGLMLWVQYPVEAIFFLLILKPHDVNFVQECQKCQICVI